MGDDRRAAARARLGVSGTSAPTADFLQVLREHKLSLYPLAALGTLSIVDTFQLYAFGVLAPEISKALGVGKGAIGGAIAVATLAQALGPLPFAALSQRHARRALMIVVTGIAWSLVALSTGFVTAMAGLVAVLLVDGVTTASVRSLHRPFLIDSYPPEARIRAFSFYEAADSAGNVIAPLLVAALATYAHLTWRGVFVVLGLCSLTAALTTVRLRDPGIGRFDTQELRALVRGDDAPDADADHDDVSLGFFEITQRLLLIPTIRRLLYGQAVVGVLAIPLATFLAFYFDERWGLSPGERGLFSALRSGIAVAVLVAFGRRGEEMFRRDPRQVLDFVGVLLATGVIAIGFVVLIPNLPAVIALLTLALALLTLLQPLLGVVLLSVIPARMRPHCGALIGVASGVGGLFGSIFLGSIDRRFGIVGSFVALILPGLLGAHIIRSSRSLVMRDLDRMIDETLEEEEIRQVTASGGRLPMLSAKGIEFSYGPVQVLFDVDFTVDDGEMVALLGTNGAGKSTLLKVISGIGLPSGGSVRFRGHDITYLDAERRLRLGITQIPGGRAVFGPMTVAENLRVFGHTVRKNTAAVEAALDQCFEAFPRLAERRDQKAVTLSGGEQQMLGLSKALLLRPKLLLIDELSLGLAPIIVGQLLSMVEEINRAGTAVVLVEQSVNIALGLVDHAYFMEKGEVRFDGASADLLARSDLLRAVFLTGTTS